MRPRRLAGGLSVRFILRGILLALVCAYLVMISYIFLVLWRFGPW